MSEIISADLSSRILNVVGDFQEHFSDELPAYGHSYLNSYRERLGGIEGMTERERSEFLGSRPSYWIPLPMTRHSRRGS